MSIDRPHGLELVNLDHLAAWMDSQALGSGPLDDVVQLTGGSQNVLLRFSRARREYVLRRPPLNPRHDGSDTMRREARVLGALKGSNVPHAGLIAACDDASVLGAAFYLMEPLDGFNAAVGMPALHAGSPDARRAMGLSVIEALSRIAMVDYKTVGLGDLGKPDGFLERQARRWMKQLESYSEFEGWPGADGLPDVSEIGAWLDLNRPKDLQTRPHARRLPSQECPVPTGCSRGGGGNRLGTVDDRGSTRGFGLVAGDLAWARRRYESDHNRRPALGRFPRG